MTVDQDAMVVNKAAGAGGGRAVRVLDVERAGAAPATGHTPELVQLPTGRIASLRFMKLALRRRRAFWLPFAVIGLVVGLGYGALGPRNYSAAATVYLTHFPGTASTVDAQDDLAMLSTVTVGTRALALLGDHHLTPQQLLGKTPGKLASDDVLIVTIAGPTPASALARVDAVTRAYLSFRTQQYNAQMQAMEAGARNQIARLDAAIKRVTAQIVTAQAIGGARLQSLDIARAADAAQIANLRQAIAQDRLQALAISKGSRVITPGTLVPTSRKRIVAEDGLFGLLAALALGAGGVLAVAMLSDRIRRRDDVAALLGAPVGLSVPRLRRRIVRQVISRSRATVPPPIRMVAHHLDQLLEHTSPDASPPVALVVAIDDPRPIAEALAQVCRARSARGDRLAVLDATATGALARRLGSVEAGLHELDIGGSAPVTLFVPEEPWDPGERSWESRRAELASAGDAVVVLATLDLGIGASHLRPWASEAIVTVRAGRVSAQRIDSVAQLLESAGVAVASAVLLDADVHDEGAGIPQAAAQPLSTPPTRTLAHAAVPS